MPIYEYICPCGAEFEALCKLGEAAEHCPVCGATTAERRMSRFSVGGTSGQPEPAADPQPGPPPREPNLSGFTLDGNGIAETPLVIGKGADVLADDVRVTGGAKANVVNRGKFHHRRSTFD